MPHAAGMCECGGVHSEVDLLRDERDQALYWLRKLSDWGYGENAPDLAKQDWVDARAYLGPRDA